MSQKFDVLHKQVVRNNGKVTSEKITTQTIIKPSDPEPPYAKLYFRDISLLHRVQKTTQSILLELLPLMDYNNEINLSAGKKKELCRKLDFFKEHPEKGVIPNTNVIDQHLCKLCKTELITKIDMGLYLVNPNIFGKGQWKDIKQIRLNIEYNGNKKLIKAEFQK